MTEKKKSSMWKYFPIVALLSFMSYILSLVAMTSGKTPEHVEANYYQKDIQSNAILAEYANANQLSKPAEFKVDYKNKKVQFTAAKITSGKMIFSRPSDSASDKEIEISGEHSLSLQDFAAGKWKVEVLWSDGDKNYRMRKDFFVE
ncbi:FixH family protein [Lentisphaera marina]|uniref:FixH family protein n=1 Tax=Lentisphaera marina TaxID=1111041 RepID=UPI0023668614|nr:FixH family protein [Lentisphaera marina]MDD7984794.1 FixH family protein [Lentisphaera marina]